MCNVAIELRATVTVSVATALGATSQPAAHDALINAALRRAALPHAQATLTSQFPVGAGLGGSSAAGVALAAALHMARGLPTDPAALAEWSRATEVEELGIAGGRQDHYAAAFGGALGLSFDRATRVEQIPLTNAGIAALERQITVIYTGESRISGETISAVLDAYRDRVPRVVDALDRMAVLARGMRSALHASDTQTLAALIDEHWIHQKSLHPRITTERIDALEQAARAAGATAIKALGASGGGCVLVFGGRQLEQAVRGLGEILPWRVATTGVTCAVSGAAT